MLCDFQLEKATRCVCSRCGRTIKVGCGQNIAAEACGKIVGNCSGAQRGLGSLVARGLAAVGVTQARYIDWKRSLGLAARCRCAAREAWLNRFDSLDALAWSAAIGSLVAGLVAGV